MKVTFAVKVDALKDPTPRNVVDPVSETHVGTIVLDEVDLSVSSPMKAFD